MRVADRVDTAIDLSVVGTTNGAAFGLDHLEGYSMTFVSTGTCAGTVKLQASNDAFTGNVGITTPESGTSTWVDITGSSNAVNNATTVLWNTSGAYYRAVRWVYVRTSSTGTPTAVVTIHAKGPNS